MKQIILACLASAAIAGCTMSDTLTEKAEVAQTDMAYAVIVPVLMQTELPGGVSIPRGVAEPLARCITENATVSELASLAAASVTGPTADTNYIVSNILNRASTTTCATAALSGGASA